MAEPYLRQSPLAHMRLAARATVQPGDAGLWLRERRFRGQINLRGPAAESAFMRAVEGALGFAPPRLPNTVVAGDQLEALWLGPDEWLIVTPPDGAAGVIGRLKAALADRACAVTDVGEARTVICLAGPHARDVLAKGCSLDLHPRVFGPGRCAQTILAKASVILQQVDETPAYEVYVARSFAEYLWSWVEDAGLEYGVAVMEG